MMCWSFNSVFGIYHLLCEIDSVVVELGNLLPNWSIDFYRCLSFNIHRAV